MPGFCWVQWNASLSVVPSGAVQGGTDSDGSTIFVGRASHNGDTMPAKVIPSKHAAYIAYGGKEILKNTFEILCEQRFKWVPCSGRNVPQNAVDAGRTSNGEILYVGRCFHEGSHTVGKVHPSHGCLYIPFGGQEIRHDHYEILVLG